MQTQLISSAIGTILVFLIIPLALSVWTNLNAVSGLQLQPPAPLTCLGALLLGISLWPFAHELIMFSQWIGFSTLSPEQMQELISKLPDRTEAMGQVPFGIVLFAIAAAPAICEEVFFRGYLQKALLQRLPSWGAIAISAAVFGVFHISVGGLAILERVLSSAMLGVVLGWVCYRTRSIWPGIILHVIHNGLLLTLARYKDEIQQIGIVKALGWNPENESHLPAAVLVLAGVLAAGGGWLIFFGSRPNLGRHTSQPAAPENVE
jgi:sodium transport system permease protein